MSMQKAIDNVYEALVNDNEGINEALVALKEIMESEGEESALFDKPLPINNRVGRKRFEAYAKQFKVKVRFK